MAFKTDVWHLTSFVLLLFIDTAFGYYYCDNDKCSEEEYCCGENVCCKSYKVWDLWYFWCGFLFFIFLLSMCTCLWRYRLLSNGSIFLTSYTYSPLQRIDPESASQVSMAPNAFRYHGHNQVYAAPLGTPPPYNQVSKSSVKTMTPPPSYAQVIGMPNTR